MIGKTFGLFFANVVSLIYYLITAVEEARSRDREKCHPPFPLPPPSGAPWQMLDSLCQYPSTQGLREWTVYRHWVFTQALQACYTQRVLITLTYRRVPWDNYPGGIEQRVQLLIPALKQEYQTLPPVYIAKTSIITIIPRSCRFLKRRASRQRWTRLCCSLLVNSVFR